MSSKQHFVSLIHLLSLLEISINRLFINSKGDIGSFIESLLKNKFSQNPQNITEGGDKLNKSLADFYLIIFVSFRHILILLMLQAHATQYKYPVSNLIITL